MDPKKIIRLWKSPEAYHRPLTQVGFYSFGELNFEVYEGKGGHPPGEPVLIDYDHHIAFTGDISINMQGLTAEQAKYHQYVPS